MEDNFVEQTKEFVKEKLSGEATGHDWFHIERVYNNAVHIAKGENVNLLIVELAALLHDIADYKFHGGDEKIGGKVASDWLREIGVEESIVLQVKEIIDHISFKNSFGSEQTLSLEGKVVQDADRLDAIGAIGIARAFAYGGKFGREIHNPDIIAAHYQTKEEYKQNKSTSLNHFYEKLLLLKDKMNTETGKRLAEKRHDFMKHYLVEFYAEWNGEK